MKEKFPKKLRGTHRTNAIIKIAKTDNTFNRAQLRPKDFCWMGHCIHCNTIVIVEDDGRTNATVEHIVPTSAGGSIDDPLNLALACARCNNQKGIHHDSYVGRCGRADEVIEALKTKRLARWRDIE